MGDGGACCDGLCNPCGRKYGDLSCFSGKTGNFTQTARKAPKRAEKPLSGD